MKKGIKILAIVLVVAVLCGLWYWRYTSLNAYYDKNYPEREVQHFKMHELVTADDNCRVKTNINGYAFEVCDFKIIDYSDYIKSYNLKPASEEQAQNKNNKIILLTLKITNPGACSESLRLDTFNVYNMGYEETPNFDDIKAINPEIKNLAQEMHVEQGEDITYTIPFMLKRTSYRQSTWDNIDTLEFYVNVTHYPVQKVIDLRVK